MFHVLGCIVEQHSPGLVILAGLLSLVASATAMMMLARGQAASGPARIAWLLVGGCVGGSGIWSLHFIAMLGYRSGLPVTYDFPLTAVSLAIAAIFTGIGFRLAFTRMGAAAGGAVVGVAICVMHYTGMAALRIPAHAVWDANYVLASIVIGVASTSLALHVARTRADRNGYIAAALLFELGILGTHFTGMAAVTFFPDPAIAVAGTGFDQIAVVTAVSCCAFLIMALALTMAMVDHRLAQSAERESERLRVHVAELEITKQQLEETAESLTLALAAADSASHAKSQFLASMSHELRTPLNAVIGFSEMLSLQMLGPLGHERYLGYVKDIHDSGAHLLSVINDILDLSRLDAGASALEETDFEPQDIVNSALRMLAAQAAKSNVRLIADVEDGLPLIHADHRRIRQVVINVLANAVKFTPSGGSATVRAYRSGDEIAIEVIDTGIGIASEDIDKAFEVFGQVDSRLARAHEGTGLGLPLARKLMELHGGRLVLESQPGKGTTVTAYIPAKRVVAGNMRAVA